MITFFNSSFFAGLATIITGAVAIIIYFQQKNDAKVQAARVLLMEIRTAEERLGQVREKLSSDATSDFPSIFPTNSWKKYSPLFISDLDQDEIRIISNFYDYAELIEDFGRKNNDFFWVTTEERAKVVQQKLAELIIHAQTQTPPADLNVLKQGFLDVFVSDSYTYAPIKMVNEIKKYIEKVGNVTTSSAGIKLKKLAKLLK
jgi:hypothetical protein